MNRVSLENFRINQSPQALTFLTPPTRVHLLTPDPQWKPNQFIIQQPKILVQVQQNRVIPRSPVKVATLHNNTKSPDSKRLTQSTQNDKVWIDPDIESIIQKYTQQRSDKKITPIPQTSEQNNIIDACIQNYKKAQNLSSEKKQSSVSGIKSNQYIQQIKTPSQHNISPPPKTLDYQENKDLQLFTDFVNCTTFRDEESERLSRNDKNNAYCQFAPNIEDDSAFNIPNLSNIPELNISDVNKDLQYQVSQVFYKMDQSFEKEGNQDNEKVSSSIRSNNEIDQAFIQLSDRSESEATVLQPIEQQKFNIFFSKQLSQINEEEDENKHSKREESSLMNRLDSMLEEINHKIGELSIKQNVKLIEIQHKYAPKQESFNDYDDNQKLENIQIQDSQGIEGNIQQLEELVDDKNPIPQIQSRIPILNQKQVRMLKNSILLLLMFVIAIQISDFIL